MTVGEYRASGHAFGLRKSRARTYVRSKLKIGIPLLMITSATKDLVRCVDSESRRISVDCESAGAKIGTSAKLKKEIFLAIVIHIQNEL